MRPVAKEHSVIKYPLDIIMGSEANVRLLRVLSHVVETPFSVPDAARLAGLTPAGARRAFDRLLASGSIEQAGFGRTPQYRLRKQEPLIQAILLLFEKERNRYDSLIFSLRKALSDFPEISTAWINCMPTGANEPVEICVLADSKALDWISEELRARLRNIEKEYDLIIEVRIHTRADSPIPARNAEFIVSTETNKYVKDHQPISHTQREQRSLLMSQEIAKMMRSDPSLIARAKQHLDRLLADKQGTATGTISEWRQLLETYSARQLGQILVSTSSRANRLRQSSPFFAVLSPEERDRLLGSLEKAK